MKIRRKVDSSFRVHLPKEFLEQLNWNKGDYVKLYVKSNKIILVREEDLTEVNLMLHKHNSKPKIKTNIENKIPAVEDSKTIKINKNPIEQRCHKCLKKLEGSKFILNGRYICRRCRDALKEELISDIIHRKEK